MNDGQIIDDRTLYRYIASGTLMVFRNRRMSNGDDWMRDSLKLISPSR